MSFRAALLLPAAALVAVGLMVAGVLLWPDSGGSAQPVSPKAAATAVQRAGTPKLAPESNVCQSVLHRPEVKADRTFPSLYTKVSTEKGIAIVADDRVSDEAIAEAHKTIARLFRENRLSDELALEGAYVIIADRTQGILDLPEFGCLGDTASADAVGHACGVADRADYPVATVNELDLTSDPKGPCRGLNILYHELGHLVQGWTLEPSDYFDIKIAYQAALDAGKYQKDYARTNSNEYFAEATQAFFYHLDPRGGRDRAWLKSYDPEVYAILERVYGEP
jgi:hypothetical protein